MIELLVPFALLAFALMAAAHYAAPKVAGRRLPRLATYVIGVGLGILMPYAGWCLSLESAGIVAIAPREAAGGLVAITVGTGAGTVLTWALDWLLGLRAEARARQ